MAWSHNRMRQNIGGRVFSVVKLYRSGHHSFIKAPRPCQDVSLRRGMDRGESGGHDMQLHEYRAKLSVIRSFAAPAQGPHGGDVMVAPVSSEFVEAARFAITGNARPAASCPAHRFRSHLI